KCNDRFSNALRLRFGFGSLQSETGEEFVNSVKQVLNQSVAGIDKFGILSKAQLFDHVCCDILRFQDSKLTFDPNSISRWIARQGLLQLALPRLDYYRSGSGIDRRSREKVQCSERHGQQQRKQNDQIPPTQKTHDEIDSLPDRGRRGELRPIGRDQLGVLNMRHEAST